MDPRSRLVALADGRPAGQAQPGARATATEAIDRVAVTAAASPNAAGRGPGPFRPGIGVRQRPARDVDAVEAFLRGGPDARCTASPTLTPSSDSCCTRDWGTFQRVRERHRRLACGARSQQAIVAAAAGRRRRGGHARRGRAATWADLRSRARCRWSSVYQDREHEGAQVRRADAAESRPGTQATLLTSSPSLGAFRGSARSPNSRGTRARPVTPPRSSTGRPSTVGSTSSRKCCRPATAADRDPRARVRSRACRPTGCRALSSYERVVRQSDRQLRSRARAASVIERRAMPELIEADRSTTNAADGRAAGRRSR